MRVAKELIGQRFERLVVLEEAGKRHGTRYVLCKCDCGNSKIIRASYITKGYTRSCGCLSKEVSSLLSSKDIRGNKYGRLTALCPTKRRSGHEVVWECICDCGKTAFVSQAHLKQGTKSCGCLHKEIMSLVKSKDLSGQRFGRLVALNPTNKRTRGGNIVWECLCDCGQNTLVSSHSLVQGTAKSCGCLQCKGSVYLYAFESKSTRLIKIGISSNIYRRKKELQEELGDGLDILHYRVSSRSEERKIHSQLKPYKAIHPGKPKGREWFLPDHNVLKIAGF